MSYTVAGDLPEQNGESARLTTNPLLRRAPKVSASLAALTRKVGRGLLMVLPDQQGELTLRLATGNAASQTADIPLLLSGPAGSVWLDDGIRWLRVLTGIDLTAALADPSTQECPPWLTAAVAARLQGSPLYRTARIRSAQIADASKVCTLELSLQQDAHVMLGSLHAAPQTWLRLLEDCDLTALRAPEDDFFAIPWHQPVLLGWHRLSDADCAALAPGDIILPSRPAFQSNGTGRLNLAGRSWRVRYLAPAQLQLISPESSLDMESAEDLDYDAAPDSPAGEGIAEVDAPAALEALSLTLTFELGRIALPLGAVRSLAPQSILALQSGQPGDIGIFCGGRRVGQGEVVDVDGALGIRIVHWGGAC
ncbi:type III secretion system cytoplasmic ring protein SctQ [Herbaspirillum huttiense F1]|uniref:Type III secretion system cytoplasmic ring protein SctQ n=1 Tax=Herbaspirillum huttiense subsp. lycopersici TaxID=3074428 RepID=A0ABU2EU84_9BURK|nr:MULTISPECIES: type III secretion system cytoplasmic ring protein SctQ [Herbaspirillum]MBP1313306.1 type III secretion protein Q [Herbaspirillum sp. 1130]MDR9851318.1 type III secretion system cytoplasmic ring protein SctQ [Herbaspirillum huttiense SE1]MDT0358231.1 type III secretion system cytoplasmic ring protein SctQ [Herbaspirillum huttiense F1]